ncbi:MAG: hypothetical protein A2V70_21230 [Planctomycetes bacterium RBG_13_63_9]|nr:MAG: hypothetical protein A2V70_21230 [Planctomycetes bacterium RBG_13_63_9]
MRVFYLGNNRLGWQVLNWLKDEGEQIVALALHPEGRRKFAKRMIAASGLTSEHIFDASQLNRRSTLRAIANLKPDIAVSVLLGYILRPELLDLPPAGCINVHPALLPYNAGAHPNVWSIVQGTPAGVTIHYMDESIDTGDLIAQSPVPVEPVDTGETLHHKLERAALALFQQTWPSIRRQTARRVAQPTAHGTCHRVDHLRQIDEIDLDRTYRAGELIDILRARTFPPYPGAYFRLGGRKIHMRLDLCYEEDLPTPETKDEPHEN